MNTKKIQKVDVNLDAFKDVKSVDDLKKEPGKIFAHLPDEGAAYDELAEALKLPKSAAPTPKTAATGTAQ